MFTRQNIVRLLLVGLLLALLAVPVLGVAFGTGVAANDTNHRAFRDKHTHDGIASLPDGQAGAEGQVNQNFRGKAGGREARRRREETGLDRTDPRRPAPA